MPDYFVQVHSLYNWKSTLLFLGLQPDVLRFGVRLQFGVRVGLPRHLAVARSFLRLMVAKERLVVREPRSLVIPPMVNVQRH